MRVLNSRTLLVPFRNKTQAALFTTAVATFATGVILQAAARDRREFAAGFGCALVGSSAILCSYLFNYYKTLSDGENYVDFDAEAARQRDSFRTATFEKT